METGLKHGRDGDRGHGHGHGHDRGNIRGSEGHLRRRGHGNESGTFGA